MFNGETMGHDSYYTTASAVDNSQFQSHSGHFQMHPTGSDFRASYTNPAFVAELHPSQGVHDATRFPIEHHQHHQPHQPHHPNGFIQAPVSNQRHATNGFTNQHTLYDESNTDGSRMDYDSSFEGQPPMPSPMPGQVQHFGSAQQIMSPVPPLTESFRFRSTLNAPTAMIKNMDEIPVTYLNKGWDYSLSIVDTKATALLSSTTKYRTFVRISFEDQQRRQDPGGSWNAWADGRHATSDARQKPATIQAVEYVRVGRHNGGDDDDTKTQVELEGSSFDGFSVIWTAEANEKPQVKISMRFNFLSTDFSHSKGVKGITMRLCAKTSLLPSDVSHSATNDTAEICFCKVKLFREHGTERKFSKDTARVQQSIDKLKRHIAQQEGAMRIHNQVNPTNGFTKAKSSPMIGKVQKYQRTGSVSSASSAGDIGAGGAGGAGGKYTSMDELYTKLPALQRMLTSTRPVSILHLRGDTMDDPDLHSVSLPRDKSPAIKSEEQSDGAISDKMDTLEVDSSYPSPQDQVPMAVACFYILRRDQIDAEQQRYHRAIYLTQRTLKELNSRIATKWGIEPSRILRTIHVNKGGLEVEMDDDLIEESKEGQDMHLVVEEVVHETMPARVTHSTPLDTRDRKHESPPSPAMTSLILRLIF